MGDDQNATALKLQLVLHVPIDQPPSLVITQINQAFSSCQSSEPLSVRDNYVRVIQVHIHELDTYVHFST
jgi:hypothetical protein